MELRSKNKVKFKQHFTDKTKVQNSPLFRGIFLWNQLLADVQNMDKLSQFKNAIRSLLDKGFIYNLVCVMYNLVLL